MVNRVRKQNEDLLEIKVDPQTYLKRVNNEKRFAWDTEEYWEIIPTYTLARCPFCNKPYREQVDTYSLREWDLLFAYGANLLSPRAKQEKCRHFLMIQPFLNLNGIRPEKSPTEVDRKHVRFSERPHVMGVGLHEKEKSHAVIHSLPICKIEGNRFVPRYTVYTVAYFTGWRQTEISARIAAHDDYYGRSPLAAPVSEADHDWWDLKAWVNKGKLSWLDTKNNFELISGPIKDFPYGDIEGRTDPYIDHYPFTRAEMADGTYDRWIATQTQ